MSRQRVQVRIVMALALAALAAGAGCGARVTDAQIAAAGGQAQQAAGSATVEDRAGTPSAEAPGEATATQAEGVPAPGTTPTSAPNPAGAAATGDNGGATDVGVTRDSITLGLVTTLSGPIPGLFAGAVYGAQAAVAYQNSVGGVHGRKLRLQVADDQFDASTYRSQVTELTSKAFAMSGSLSLYDDVGADALEKANMPDVQIPISPRLQASPVNFTMNPSHHGSPTGPWNWLKSHYPENLKVGGLSGDVPAAKEGFRDIRLAAESVGFQFAYDRAYTVTETDFTADIVRMRQAGVNLVFVSAEANTVARVAKAMKQQSFNALLVAFNTAYDSAYPVLAGAAGEGTIIMTSQAMYQGEDSAYVPEVRLLNQWIQKVKPGFRTNAYAAFGWGSTRLLIKAMMDAPPALTRPSVLAALRKIDQWNGYGLFPDAGPASRRAPTCFLMLRVRGGKFERYDSPPPGFVCKDSVFHRSR